MDIVNLAPDPNRVREWTDYLRTTDIGQEQNSLYTETDDGHMRMCCLGVGCYIAGIKGPWRYASLPPAEWLEWLGFDIDIPVKECEGFGVLSLRQVQEHGQGDFDLIVGFPDDLMIQGTDEFVSAMKDHPRERLSSLSPSVLNDFGFTFPQIADVIDRFDIVGVWIR